MNEKDRRAELDVTKTEEHRVFHIKHQSRSLNLALHSQQAGFYSSLPACIHWACVLDHNLELCFAVKGRETRQKSSIMMLEDVCTIDDMCHRV